MLSIVLPCFNPAANWVENVALHYGEIRATISETELLIVVDGSGMNVTQTELQKLLSLIPGVKIIERGENKGKGFSLREGIAQAKGGFIIYTDIDFPYTFESFIKVYSSLTEKNAEVVTGVRNEEYYAHLPKARVRISRLLKGFIKTFLRIPIADTQCGLKGMNKKGKEIFLQTSINRYLFDLEFIFLAARSKVRIATVDVRLRPEVHLSQMNWKILLQELGNFLKIFVRSINNQRWRIN